ncbi:MBL fold metallo-hydrolase [candidate division KSB1 bacterium]|nr:MBL fold metallo-hydrolase [candidate division KSB1 bacterium]
MKITFHGAAGEVTGSQHLLENKSHKVLFDCGLFQGRRQEAYDKNRHPSYLPADLDAVVLSHAHLDHTGKLPRLAALGFSGIVHSTPVTAELCDPLLRDSAHIQEKDIEFVNKLHRKKGLPPFKILYETADAEAILDKFTTHELHVPFEPVPGIKVTYIEAGHLLGSAQVQIDVKTSAGNHRIGFTGDLGRVRLPILNDPEQLSDLDTLICESTYGNRDHESADNLLPELCEVITSTCDKGGKVIIPAFALERTQDLLLHLAQLRKSGTLRGDIPVVVDSPLAVKATEIFAAHPEVYDKETQAVIASGINPFHFPGLTFTHNVEESKALNDRPGPMIIISASGMMEAGRILHHLKNNIEEARNTVLVVSFQAEHTLGRRIADRVKQVNIFGEPYQLRARVKILNAFSGHAGRTELIDYIRRVVKNSPRLKRILFVHGEPEAAKSLMEAVSAFTRVPLHYPELGEGVEI